MQIVGLDIGGSKTHAVSRHWTGTMEVFAGSANLASVGDVGAGRQLDAITVEYSLHEGRFWLPRSRTVQLALPGSIRPAIPTST